MSSPDLRMAARLACALGAALLLAGCFRPVYGGVAASSVMPLKSEPSDVAALMKTVDVKPYEGRNGERVRNELIFMLRGGDGPGPVAYRLEFTRLLEAKQAAIVNPFIDISQTATVSIQASFRLTRAGSIDPIMTGDTFGTATYFSGLQRYANLRAQRDAEDRITTQLAERVRARLLSYFSTGK